MGVAMRKAFIPQAALVIALLGVGAAPDAQPRATVATILMENRLAAGGAERAGTLQTKYAYSGQGLSGYATRTVDLTSGYFVESYAVGPVSGGSGYDGKTPWMRDLSGADTPQTGGDRVALAVNAAYRKANLWWRPGFAGAAITYAGRESDGARSEDHLSIKPKDGERFDAWFDTRTHLLSRIGERQEFFATRTWYTHYARTAGLMLPLLTTIDRGTGKANYETLKLVAARITSARPASAYARPSQPPTGASIARGASSTTLPFRLLNDHIYIDATVDGKGPFTFIVDTGGHTLLSPHVVSSLKLNAAGKAASSGAGEKTATTAFAKVREIAFGGVRMHDQTAFVTPVYDAAIEGIPVDGMVGFEVFRRFGVTIDYGKRTITFYDPRTFTPSDAGVEIPFKFYDHLPDVEGRVAGFPARFDIDTGSRSELDLTSPFVRRARLREKYPHAESAITGWGVGGAVRSTVIRLPELRLGDVTVRDVVGELSDATFGSFSDANYEGNIGSALLKRFVVTFDYARARMYLKAIVPEPSDVGTFDKSGMWLNAESAGYVVTSLDERSPAGEAGLAAGDVIMAIDGRAAQMRKLSDARATLRDLPAGTVVRVDFKRGAARKTADIKLRDLTNQK
jgi:hypothetical protein